MLTRLLCRRCKSGRLLRLAVMNPKDNTVFRCLDCGFIFSPSQATFQPSRTTGRGG